MRKPFFCIYENKDADQLCGDCTADQHLCFRFKCSTVPVLPKSEISSLYPSSVAVQPCFCQTWLETRRQIFSRQGSYYFIDYVQNFSIKTYVVGTNYNSLANQILYNECLNLNQWQL